MPPKAHFYFLIVFVLSSGGSRTPQIQDEPSVTELLMVVKKDFQPMKYRASDYCYTGQRS
jgi:hypothetical protein